MIVERKLTRTEPETEPTPAHCCCRDELSVNAGCKLHGIGLSALHRNMIVDEMERRRALYVRDEG